MCVARYGTQLPLFQPCKGGMFDGVGTLTFKQSEFAYLKSIFSKTITYTIAPENIRREVAENPNTFAGIIVNLDESHIILYRQTYSYKYYVEMNVKEYQRDRDAILKAYYVNTILSGTVHPPSIGHGVSTIFLLFHNAPVKEFVKMCQFYFFLPYLSAFSKIHPEKP